MLSCSTLCQCTGVVAGLGCRAFSCRQSPAAQFVFAIHMEVAHQGIVWRDTTKQVVAQSGVQRQEIIRTDLVNIEAPGAHGAALGAAQGGSFAGRGGRGHVRPGIVLPSLLARGRGQSHAFSSLREALHPGAEGLLKE